MNHYFLPNSTEKLSPLSENIDVLYSQSTEKLMAAMSYRLIEESMTLNPFAKQLVLVANSGMQRYVELAYAKTRGICTQIDIGYSGSFVNRVLRQLLGETALNKRLDTRQITFLLLQLFEQQSVDEPALNKLLTQYVGSESRFLFAQEIAQLFQRYEDDRPELIQAWLNNKTQTEHPHEAWQKALYLACHNTYLPNVQKQNQADILAQLDKALAQLNEQQRNALLNQIPAHIHVFGFHALPPFRLAVLLRLARIAKIHFYTLNPSQQFWFDTVSASQKLSAEHSGQAVAALLEVGHPLISRFATAGRHLLSVLQDFSGEFLEHTVPDGNELDCLRATLLQLDTPTSRQALQQACQTALDTGQQAIQIHANSSIRREVEVLYNKLSAVFEQGNYSPADVLVIVPDLPAYAPHIRAVFGRGTPERKEIGSHSPQDKNPIPYSIANQSALDENPEIQTFLFILETLFQDFSAEKLLELCHLLAGFESFDLNETHLKTLNHWFLESRFSHQFFNDPTGRYASFEKLFNALLLAFIGGEQTTVGNTIAAPFYSPHLTETFLVLNRIYQAFLPFATLPHQQLSLADWQQQLQKMADAFFPKGHTLYQVLYEWGAWSENHADTLAATQFKTHATFDFTTILLDFKTHISKEALHGPFLSGGISCCAMMPMRAIPARYICLLGLNDGYPHINLKNPLDLRLATPKASDQNRYNEACYSFLETLLSAADQLYLSYIGQDGQTGDRLVPSVLLRELVDYFEGIHPAYAKAMTQYHPLHSYLEKQTYQPIFANHPMPNAETVLTPQSTNEKLLSCQDFAKALTKPLDYYLTQVLGAHSNKSFEDTLLTHELLGFDYLSHYQYAKISLDCYLQQLQQSDKQTNEEASFHPSQYVEDLKNYIFHPSQYLKDLENHDQQFAEWQTLWQQNLLSNACVTTALIQQSRESVASLYEPLSNFFTPQPPLKIEKNLRLDDAQLNLALNVYFSPKKGLLHYYVSKYKAWHLYHAWCSHLLYHVYWVDDNFYTPQPTTLLCRDKQIHFLAMHKQDAQAALDDLLTLFKQISERPIDFIQEKEEKKQALIDVLKQTHPYQKLFQAFYPDQDTYDAAMQTVISQMFIIIETMKKHIKPAH